MEPCNPPSEHTLRLRRPCGQTLGLALILFGLLLALGEVVLRTEVLQSHVVASSREGRHRQFELQLGQLETVVARDGPIDCISLGNSMIWHSVNPEAFAEGYRRPDLTSQAIRDGWYYTGDMGYLADGHLYISGPKKDLIIVGGRNIYPQDLEAIANDVPGIYPGRAAAFGLMDETPGSEGIVMVCELKDAFEGKDTVDIERQLRQRGVRHMDVTLEDVRLVERRWLIKMSSGKIARSANRDKYLREFRGA